MSEEGVIIWTITRWPRDLPSVKYAARRHFCYHDHSEPEQGMPLTADTLEGIRALLPPGLHNLGRLPDDDPVIVESWI